MGLTYWVRFRHRTGAVSLFSFGSAVSRACWVILNEGNGLVLEQWDEDSEGRRS